MHPIVPATPCRLPFKLFVLLLCGTTILSLPAPAQTLAFPGALGFGEYATGGRAGSVYHVTTLADSGTGSFRDAVSQPNRIIVFDVGGTITLNSAVSCVNNLTIAGQTAPGGGIAIIGHEVSFSARTNEIVRFLRIRPGSLSSSGEDAINMGDGTNMIFDHVSLEFAGYNNIDAHGNNGSDAITVQNSIIGDPMYNGTSAKQGFGAHSEHLGGKMAWYYNLWVSEHNRQPLAKIDTIFVNNTEYNFQAGYTVASTSGSFRHDIIANYFITGPTDPTGANAFYQMNANQSIYSMGNLIDNNNDGVLNGGPINPGGGGTVLTAPWSTLSTNTTVYTAAGAYYQDVSLAGALPYDQLDSLIISQIKTLGSGPAGTGAGTAGPGASLYYDQTSTGLGNNGYGVINGGVALVDSDGDGMPDYWEKALGLNPNSAMTIAADGYANIEHYLNWLAAPHALTGTGTPVDADLWEFTGGFTNASPVYAVNNASNGTVTLNSSHIAHFVPAANFSGLGSFQFTVTANDGTRCTNTVAVLMTPPVTTPQNLTWVGDGVANVWTNGGPANWSNGTNLVPFAAGDSVTFDDTGSNTPAINLSGAISAGTVYVVANNQNYTFASSGYLSGGTALFKTGAGQLTLDTTNTFSGGTLINEGVVQIGDGVSLNGGISGSVTNNDTLIFATPGVMTSSASVSGGGTVTETGPGTLTLSGTETYTGPTTLAAGALAFSGSVPPSDITDNGLLTLAPSSSQIYGNVISGPGAVAVNAAAVLNLAGSNTFTGNLTNNSGFLILSNNSAGLGTVVYNGGFVVPAANSIITNNFSIPGTSANDLCMMATNSGTATWAGNIIMGGSAQWRPGSDGGTLTFLGNAVMGSHIFIVPRGSMIFASNAMVSSTVSGYLGRDGSGNKRSSNITIRDNASVSMAGCSVGGGKVGGYVTITVQNNGSLSLGTNLDLHNIANAAAASTLRLDGGTLTVGGFTKTQTTYTNVIDFNGGTLKSSANNALFLPAFTASTNAVQAGGAVIDDGGFAITIGAPLIHDPALGSAPDGGLTKLDTGTVTLTAGDTYNGPTIINGGTLVLTGAGAVAATTNIYVGSGATFDVSSEGSFTLGSGKMLWGNGSLKGNITIGGATLAPGSNSMGTLTFNNSLLLSSDSTSVFKISHLPLTNDTAHIFGNCTQGGTLIVTNVGGTQLKAGDTFHLFIFGGYSGAFSGVILPPLPLGLVWNTNNLNTTGTISVVLNTAPVISSISVSGSGLGLSGTGGVGNAYYVLLNATNLSTTAGNWTPLLTNQFDNSGNFNFTTNANTSAPQNFYRLQLQ